MAAVEAIGADFDFGRVLSRAFDVIGRNFIPFFALSLIASVPGIVLRASLVATSAGFTSARVYTLLGAYVLALVCGVILQAALTYCTSAALRRQPVSLVRGLGIGVSEFFPVLGLGILVALSVFFGMLLLIVPGVILLLMLSVSVPVRVIEGKGVIESMSRSSDLTRGHRWAILGILVITYMGTGIVSVTAQSLTGGAIIASGSSQSWLELLVGGLTGAITAMIVTTVVVSLYYELRGNKEGILPEQIASVFD
jgi:hypothetical protein